MTLFTLFVALLNLAIGFALAWRLRRAGDALLLDPGASPVFDAISPGKTAAAPEPFGLSPTSRILIPPQWSALLHQQGVQAGSFTEAAMPVFLLEIDRYLEQLEEIECQVLAASGASKAKTLQQLVDRLKEINENWLEGQTQAAEQLAHHNYPDQRFQNVGRELEDALLDQAAQIQIAQTNVDRLKLHMGSDADCSRLRAELLRVIELTHGLRDCSMHALSVVFRLENRLEPLSCIETDEGRTAPLNRLQIDQILEAWRRDGPPSGKEASAALVDIDRAGDLNKRLGVRTVDRMLEALGRLIEQLQDPDRQKIARYAGASFLLLLDGADLTAAAGAVERLRRAVEASTFVADETEAKLTFSAGVTAIGRNEAISALMGRLEQTRDAAKQAGRNRVYVDQDDETRPVPPESDLAEERVIRIPGEAPEEAAPELAGAIGSIG